MRVAFAGTPEFALPALAALTARHDVVGVLTQPDRPGGRGRKLRASPVKLAAEAQQLPLAQPQTLGPAARAQLAAWRPEVLVVVAYGLILPREILSLPPLGCLNVHASLLPRWRGAAPIQRALLAGDARTGVSIMQMDAGLDTGPVLLQRSIEITPDHTAASLRAELAVLGAEALIEVLPGLASGALTARAQPSEGITYAARIEKSEAVIDWAGDASRIERQVRAFNPWPVAETRLEGETLRIFAARAIPEGAHALGAPAEGLSEENRSPTAPNRFDPGAIVATDEGSVIVQCGRGQLAITEVQRPGRRRVSARDYSHGLTLIGRRLG